MTGIRGKKKLFLKYLSNNATARLDTFVRLDFEDKAIQRFSGIIFQYIEIIT